MPDDNGNGRPRRGRARTNRLRIHRARRGVEALELRLAGHSFAEIGERMGVSAPRAFQLVTGELDRLNAKRAELGPQVVRTELERLDRLLTAVWPKAAERGDLAAVDRVLAIMQRRARLLGIDLANKQSAPAAGTVVLTVNEVLVNNAREAIGNATSNVIEGGIIEGSASNGDRAAAPGPAALPDQ